MILRREYYRHNANYVECTRSDGLAIASYPNIVLNAEGSVTGSRNNTARIAATATPDTGGVVTINTATGNNQESQSVTFTVGASLNFTLVKADTGAGGTYGPDPVLLGNNVKYRLRMTNTNTSLGANGLQLSRLFPRRQPLLVWRLLQQTPQIYGHVVH